jgi:hypothetical protein
VEAAVARKGGKTRDERSAPASAAAASEMYSGGVVNRVGSSERSKGTCLHHIDTKSSSWLQNPSDRLMRHASSLCLAR